jgi:hypothetical protein
LTLDTVSHAASVDGQRISLTPTEFRLLRFLMANPGRVYTRQQLLDNVWGDHVYIEDRTVDIHIRRLRVALGRCGRVRWWKPFAVPAINSQFSVRVRTRFRPRDRPGGVVCEGFCCAASAADWLGLALLAWISQGPAWGVGGSLRSASPLLVCVHPGSWQHWLAWLDAPEK